MGVGTTKHLLAKVGQWPPALLAWLPVAAVWLLSLLMLVYVRASVMPELQERAEQDLQRRAEVLGTRISL